MILWWVFLDRILRPTFMRCCDVVYVSLSLEFIIDKIMRLNS